MSLPRLTLDVTPLLESQWTGIPVFTRRLLRALQASGRVSLDYAVRLERVPEAAVERALRQGSGTFLRDLVERGATEGEPIAAGQPLLYPSVKPAPGVVAREASTIHDISTLVMPETHAAINVTHHLAPLRQQLLTDEVVFCCSAATRAALTSAFPWVAPKARLAGRRDPGAARPEGGVARDLHRLRLGIREVPPAEARGVPGAALGL